MLIRLLCCMVLLCLPLAACSSDQASKFDEAMQAYAEKNYSKAADLFLIEAKRGNAPAQFNLGNMYSMGQGVKANLVDAYAWWSVAAANGEVQALGQMGKTAKMMNPAQLNKAQDLARDYYEKYKE